MPFAQDLRSVLRGLRRTPGINLVIVLSLVLATGATTAMFSIVNTVLLKPLPYADSTNVIIAWTTNALNGAQEQYTSLPNLQDWRARSRSFDSLTTYREADGPLVVDDGLARRPSGMNTPSSHLNYSRCSVYVLFQCMRRSTARPFRGG